MNKFLFISLLSAVALNAGKPVTAVAQHHPMQTVEDFRQDAGSKDVLESPDNTDGVIDIVE